MQTQLCEFSERTNRERGASLVEYALLVALIALVCVVAVGFLGEETQQPYNDLASRLRQ